MVLDRLAVYDVIYKLASSGGGAEELFGTSASLAREAFKRSLIGKGFPSLWFEIPLAGPPSFDLHVAFSREALHAGVQRSSGVSSGYDELFRWYAEEETGGHGLAFAYDVGEGRIDAPAIHVNVNNAPLSSMNRFFELAGGEDVPKLYDDFARHIPQGWRVWYAGVHPGRPGSPVRVDCFVDKALKEAYRGDVAVLEHDLRSCGFEAIGAALHNLAMPVLQSPFSLELQLDVMRDGALGPTLGISAGFPFVALKSMRQLFQEGEAGAELMEAVERMGLADRRWRYIPGASFATRVPVDGEMLALYCVPTFVKLRMRDGQALDAKVYLQASASAPK